MDRETVISAIVSAFQTVERDDSCTLHEAQLTDQGMQRIISPKEFVEAKRLDQHLNWRDVPTSAIDECDAALSHLSPEGWRFYIPAYMSRAVELLDEPIWKTWLPGAVVHHLTYPEKDIPLQFYALDRFKLLDAAQVSAVAAFLKFVSTHASEEASIRESAQVALKRYWGMAQNQRPTLSLDTDALRRST